MSARDGWKAGMPDQGGVPRIRMLASVIDADEARLVVDGGVDLVDTKDVALGPMAALDLARVRAVVAAVAGRVPVSAVLDEPGPHAGATPRALVQPLLEAGVDILKWPLGELADPGSRIAALQPVAGLAPLVLVFAADRVFGADWIARARDAGAAGVMLDTWDKGRGGLLQARGLDMLGAFVAQAHAAGLWAGLAGTLRREQVGSLAATGADVLGFRSALCRGPRHASRVDAAAVAEVRHAVDSVPAPVTGGASGITQPAARPR